MQTSSANNRGLVDPVMMVKIGNGASLAEVLHPKSAGPVATHAAKPGQRRGVPIDHGDQGGIARHGFQQSFNRGLCK